MNKIEAPDLKSMSTDDLCQMMLICGMSDDASDKAFVGFCRDELARRKPVATPKAPA